MPRSGDVYQLRIWLPEEKKYLRKSLKTTDYETARNRAKEEVLRVMSDTKQGKKQFGVKLGELIEEYLEWRYQDVKDGVITSGRYTTIRSQCRAVLRIKSPELKVRELDENSFYDWGQMRRNDNPSITLVTIRNETATLGQVFEYAFRKGYSNFPKMHFRTTKISLDQVGRRDVFTEKEYSKLTKYFKTFTSKSHNKNEDELIERKKIRDYILIISNTLMRTGELRQLRWGDILEFRKDTDDVGQEITLVKIRIRKEISKTRIGREIWVHPDWKEKFLSCFEQSLNPNSFYLSPNFVNKGMTKWTEKVSSVYLEEIWDEYNWYCYCLKQVPNNLTHIDYENCSTGFLTHNVLNQKSTFETEDGPTVRLAKNEVITDINQSRLVDAISFSMDEIPADKNKKLNYLIKDI